MNRGGRNLLTYLGFFFVLVLLPFIFSAEPDTYLEIPNSPPELSQLIPNQSWPGGTNLTDSFNLNDYFIDAEYNLSYSFSSVADINITISPNGSVSFYPTPSFSGTRTVVFNASDGEYSVLSNLVYLEVGNDIFPPKWYNPRINRNKVYQSTNVDFSIDWRDNFELYNYSFQVNQEGIWTNYSGFLNGSSDTATHSVLITTPPGKVVEWKGCAWDPTGNHNCSEIQSFDILVTPENPPVSGGEDEDDDNYDYSRPSGGDFGQYVENIFVTAPQSDFSLSVNYFAVSVKQGESKTRVIEISNTGDNPLNFSLSVKDLSEFIELSETFFELYPGEVKSITMDFKADFDTELGEYLGALVIDSFKEARVPIVIDVNDVDLLFEVLVTILNERNTVKPGRDAVARLDINNLKDQVLTDAILQYSVKDFNGNIYNSGEENISFDYFLSLTRALEIPEEAPLGPYIFYARVFNEKASALNSAAFEVGTRFEFAYYLKVSVISFFILVFSFIIFLLLLRYRKQLDKGKALNLYIRLNEMRLLINEEKFDEAASLYIKVKKIYGQKISEDVLQDKVKLAEEIKKLSSQIDLNSPPPKKEAEGKKGEKKEGDGSEEGGSSDEGGEEAESKEESSSGEEPKKEEPVSEGDEKEKQGEEESSKNEQKEESESVVKKSEPVPEKPAVKPAAVPVARPSVTPVSKPPVQKKVVPKKPITPLVKKVVPKPAVKSAGVPVAKPPITSAAKPLVQKKAISKKVVKKTVAKPIVKKIVPKSAPKPVVASPAKPLVQKKVVPKKEEVKK